MSGDGVWDYATGAFIPAASNTAGFVIRAVPPEGEPVPASEVLDDDVLEADECGDETEPVGEDDGGDRPD